MNAQRRDVYAWRVRLRFICREGLLGGKEKEAIATIYGMLSNTGSQPYIAQEDQARLLGQLTITLAQFVMLRAKGTLYYVSYGQRRVMEMWVGLPVR